MEASLLMPVILLLSFLMLVLPIRMYQNMAIYAFAYDTALTYSGRNVAIAHVERIAGRKVLYMVTTKDRVITVTCRYGNETQSVSLNFSPTGHMEWLKDEMTVTEYGR